MDALGLGFDDLSAFNANLLYATVTPFGQKGPMRDYRATDIVASAMSGLLFLNGDPEDPPNQPTSEQAYHMASLALVSGLLIARVGAQRAPAGWRPATRVDVSLQEAAAMATLQNAPPNAYRWYGSIAQRRGLLGLTGARTLHQCRDGRWVSFVVPPYRWGAFLEWLDDEGVDSEVRNQEFEEIAYRRTNASATGQAIAELAGRYDAEALYHEGQRRRLLVMPVNDVSDLVADRQLVAREFFATTQHPDLDALTDAGAPVLFDGERRLPPRSAPTLAQHNQEVYGELLGLDRGALDELRVRGVV
jgi:crotonobetainyl-CoA:carnitine CoA-transferase CaiB-like acyl-CoA transferase